MSKVNWDHTVHYVNDLSEVEAEFAKNGLSCRFGGIHPDGGTKNSLSYFGLTYLEFLAIENLDIVKNTNQLISKDAGQYLPKYEWLSRPALRTDSIECLYDRLKSYGLSYSPVFKGTRRTQDGELLEWKLLTINGDYMELPYPFVISWEMADDARYTYLEQKKLLHQHEIQSIEIVEAIFYVDQPRKVVDHWSEVFELPKIDETHLAIGSKVFSFERGQENRMTDILFSTASDRSFDFHIGGGHYRTK